MDVVCFSTKKHCRIDPVPSITTHTSSIRSMSLGPVSLRYAWTGVTAPLEQSLFSLRTR